MLRILQLLSAAVVVLTSVPALAAFSLGPGYPQRDGGGGRPVALTSPGTPNPLSEPKTGFNRADCFDKAQTVKLRLSDIPAEATDIEVWARRDNTSCADPANRPGGANVQCWKVAHWTRADVVNKEVSFKPLQLIQAIDKQTSVDTADGLDPETVCAKDAHMMPRLVSLQIMAVNAGTVVGWSSFGGAPGAVIAVWTAYDLAGPNPPTDLSVKAFPGALQANFTPLSQPPADFGGYDVYCFPGSAGGTGCPSHPFVAGQFPSSELEQYLCTTGMPSATGTMTVPGLKGGVPYAVAVAAHDVAGNPGKMSEVKCETPTEAAPLPVVSNDNDADSVKSGCDCRVGAPQSSSFGVAAVALALAIVSRRRQR